MDIGLVLSIVVGGLSVLVVFLLGWQIYTMININSIINRKIKKDLKKAEENLEKEVNGSMALVFAKLIDVSTAIGNKELILDHHIRGLSLALGSEYEDAVLLLSGKTKEFIRIEDITVPTKEREMILTELCAYKKAHKGKEWQNRQDVLLVGELASLLLNRI